MCLAQDRRFKTPNKAVYRPPASKCQSARLVESIFKPRAYRLPKVAAPSTPTVRITAAASEPETPQKAAADAKPAALSKKTEQASPKISNASISLRPRLEPPIKDVTMAPADDLLTLRTAKSFDENREDEYSMKWTCQSTKSLGKGEGRIRLELDFRDIPVGGIIDLPREASATQKNNGLDEDDLTVSMSNLRVKKPEPLRLDEEDTFLVTKKESAIFESPAVTFRNYDVIPTPPTPRHEMPPCQHFDKFPVPRHLLLPSFIN